MSEHSHPKREGEQEGAADDAEVYLGSEAGRWLLLLLPPQFHGCLRRGDVSKVNRKASFSLPTVGERAKVSEDGSGADDAGAPAETEREPLGGSEQPAVDRRS